MFVDRVNLKLELDVGGVKHTIPAGNIKNFELRLDPWGFTLSMDWWVICFQSQSEDELFAGFTKRDLISLTVTIDRTFDEVGSTPSPLVIKGLVREKWVTERAFPDVQGSPVLQRRYALEAADRAAVLWRQHFPVALYADKSLKQLFEDNKPDGLKLAYDWAAADTTHAVQSLGLGAGGDPASFYDFAFWVTDRQNAGIFFDAATEEYKFAGAKPSGGTEITVPVGDIELVEIVFPRLYRNSAAVLNSHTEAATKKKEIANADGVTGVRRDHLITSAVESDLTARSTLETSRLAQPEPELTLRFSQYPSVTLKPGMIYNFDDDDWSSNLYYKTKKYRLHRLDIRGRAQSQIPTDDLDGESNAYELEVEAGLELSTDPVFRHPPGIVAPHWPFYVEGKIVSEVGEAAEGTYQAYPNQTTALDYYHVKIPLWNLTIIVPYNPGLVSGHFYFPAYKDERALIALDFRSAWIKRFLDWRPGARLPKETQGDHILFGKKAKNETSVRHVYEDAKPVLSIKRTLEGDTQTIKISEGVIFIETKEESS